MSNQFSHLKLDLNKPGGKIIYIGDPMCSWCWGVAEHLTKLKNAYSDTLDFEILMGGLRPGGGDPWNSQMKEFLRHHWEQVYERSGQVFNYELFDLPTFNYDTEPPSRAVVVVRENYQKKAFDFFKSVQHAFYVKNNDPGKLETYRDLCEDMEIPFTEFTSLFMSDEYKQKVKADFAKSKQMGIRGFPSVVYQNNNVQEIVANGYATFETMSARIETLVKQSVR